MGLSILQRPGCGRAVSLPRASHNNIALSPSFKPYCTSRGHRQRKPCVRVDAILLSPLRNFFADGKEKLAGNKEVGHVNGTPLQSQSMDREGKAAPVFSTFIWPREMPASGAVELWGSFNQWEAAYKMIRRDGQWVTQLLLQPGHYEFKFKVDGQWRTSPQELEVNCSDGHLNNFRTVVPTASVGMHTKISGPVFVVGEWDGWQIATRLEHQPGSDWHYAHLHLPPGSFHYQFVVDGILGVDSQDESEVFMLPGRGAAHQLWSQEPPMTRLFYCTGWEETHLLFKRVIPGQDNAPEFHRQRMICPNSRGNDLGRWHMATVIPHAENEVIEFYLTNGKTGDLVLEDKMGKNQMYTIPKTGSFKLIEGRIKPFPRGGEPRLMLVSDIDGTMIGDHGAIDQFGSSRRFRDYWENGPALAGSVLVFNTGRSLGQVKDLLKVEDVAKPDAIISAVGTKVYISTDRYGRARSGGMSWQEDMAWTFSLDEGWNINTVRRVANRLIREFNNPAMLSTLDDGSEHQHRYAFTAESSVVPHVTHTLASACQKEGLEVRIIVSGQGTHRYVDCVPMNAGKEKALQYLRRKYGVPEYLCCAAGDSGNDVLMLEGDHPGIVVGNAQPELVSWLVHQPQDGKVVYTDASLADGIMEGLARHGLY